MTTFVVSQHIPSTTDGQAEIRSENVSADFYKTNQAGNAVTFYRSLSPSSTRYGTIRGSGDEKVAFFSRVISVKVAPPAQPPKPEPSSDDTDEPSDFDTD